MIITGVGGQGLITLISVIDEAAAIEGHDVRSSELHGLSQRGGSVEIHAKFGRKIYSPLIPKGGADLIFSLEISEALKGSVFAGLKTQFLVNKHSMPYLNGLAQDEILKSLAATAKEDNLHLIEASKLCKEKLQKEVAAGIYLLGYAVLNGLIPLSEQSVLKAIENVIPEKYRELNIKAFNLAKHG